jgi:thiamine pyrophosphokinase
LGSRSGRPAAAAATGQLPGNCLAKAIVVADGDVPARADLDAAWPGWAAGAAVVIAADGGWEKTAALGLRPNLLVGDADSLAPERYAAAVATPGLVVERSPVAKDESDTELAMLAALKRGATHIVILGALGGQRFDHALANVGLLALPDPAAVTAELLDGTTRVRLLRAPAPGGGAAAADLDGAVGDLVSLLPMGATAEGVTTRGLAYALADEDLRPGPARGLSNLRSSPAAGVSLRRGSLVVVETRAGPGRGPAGKEQER